MTVEQIQKMLQESSIQIERGDDEESDSDLSIENVEVSDHDSKSEQDMSDNEFDLSDNELETSLDDGEFYIGKDKITKWQKKEFTTSKIRQYNIINVVPGPKECARNIVSEMEAFLKIIDLDMVDEIVKCTNMYISNLRQRVQYSRTRDCLDTSRCEILAYFGLLFLIGVKKGHHVNVKELWAADGSGIEVTRAAMSYKRFLFLGRCLRFDDYKTRVERRKIDKLAAIRTMLDLFLKNIDKNYNLSEYTTIDEMLHPFRGRCQWIQYIPSKPAKYGIKMFALCDAKTFYTSKLEIYVGKQPPGPYEVSNSPIDVVKRLVKPIEKSKRNLTTDNWYTSILLADFLLHKKITLIGTLRKNKREIPTEFLPDKKKAIGSCVFGFQKNKTLVSYVPRKKQAVILLSTMHYDSKIDVETRKPEIIMDYNSTKGGVDTVDKMCAAYSVSRITKRWPLVIFYSLMNIAGINAQILYSYSELNDAPNVRRLFLKTLAFDLMKEHLASRAQISSLPSDISSFLKMKYAVTKPSDVPITPTPKRGTCFECGRIKNAATTMKCTKCMMFVCKVHSKKVIMCEQCSNYDNDNDV